MKSWRLAAEAAGPPQQPTYPAAEGVGELPHWVGERLLRDRPTPSSSVLAGWAASWAAQAERTPAGKVTFQVLQALESLPYRAMGASAEPAEQVVRAEMDSPAVGPGMQTVGPEAVEELTERARQRLRLGETAHLGAVAGSQ